MASTPPCISLLGKTALQREEKLFFAFLEKGGRKLYPQHVPEYDSQYLTIDNDIINQAMPPQEEKNMVKDDVIKPSPYFLNVVHTAMGTVPYYLLITMAETPE
ncbi:hypothetical protein LOAG_03544 [Loa loa]|uniref:Uncharacterized protein n=1 Tax=Loa loa TaxID=7209 RepID=A0A1S0U4F2_LOALO|nr:hypothetical protein LOAG_03544 [Loa loa]EFO24937.1 hypothetical protein LOAG_03544 [Loa loa]